MLQAPRKSYADLQREQMAAATSRTPSVSRDLIEAAAWRLSSERLCRTMPLVRTYPSATRFEYDQRVLGVHGWVAGEVQTVENGAIRATYHYGATARTSTQA